MNSQLCQNKFRSNPDLLQKPSKTIVFVEDQPQEVQFLLFHKRLWNKHLMLMSNIGSEMNSTRGKIVSYTIKTQNKQSETTKHKAKQKQNKTKQNKTNRVKRCFDFWFAHCSKTSRSKESEIELFVWNVFSVQWINLNRNSWSSRIAHLCKTIKKINH